jgi:hypothetical protein
MKGFDMTIFGFLGVEPYLRKNSKVGMQVKHFDETPNSKKEYPLIGQVKKDGVFAFVVTKENKDVGIFSRTGKRYTNVKHLEDKVRKEDRPAAVYIAELCNNKCSLEVLSGIVNPNRKAKLSNDKKSLLPYMELYYHDYVLINYFIKGGFNLDYSARLNDLYSCIDADYILKGFELNNEKEVRAFAQEMIDKGEEGAVFKRPDCYWVSGHKGYRSMKIVKGVSYDLLCIGYEEGKGKYKGLVANLFFRWKNKETLKAMLGKGWTHEDAKEMFDNPTCIDKVYKVYALQESSRGKLRLPKVGEQRFDKDKPDV